MLHRNIIRVSSSSWLAPAVYVLKKSGELRICIDYRKLNKRTMKDAYPLPLPDEVQDRLAGAFILTGSAIRLLAASSARRRSFGSYLLQRWYGSRYRQDRCRAELAYTNRRYRGTAVPGVDIMICEKLCSLFIISHKKQWNSTGKRTASNHFRC